MELVDGRGVRRARNEFIFLSLRVRFSHTRYDPIVSLLLPPALRRLYDSALSASNLNIMEFGLRGDNGDRDAGDCCRFVDGDGTCTQSWLKRRRAASAFTAGVRDRRIDRGLR